MSVAYHVSFQVRATLEGFFALREAAGVLAHLLVLLPDMAVHVGFFIEFYPTLLAR